MDYWVFVNPYYMDGPGWRDHYYGANNNQIVINNTYITNVENITIVENSGTYQGQNYNAGPSIASFEKEAGKKIEVVAVKDNSNPGKDGISGKEISMYRPQVNAKDATTAKPSKIVPLESVKHNEALKVNNSGKGNSPATVKQDGTAQKPVNTNNGQQVNHLKGNSGTYDNQAIPKQRENKEQVNPQQRGNSGQPVKQQPAKTQNSGQPVKQQPAQKQNNRQSLNENPVQKQPTRSSNNLGKAEPQKQNAHAVNKPGEKRTH
jgi:hypothetical protein